MTEHQTTVTSVRFRLGSFAISLVALITIWAWPEIQGLSPEGKRLAAVGVMMAILWSTQSLPLAVTSIIPLVAFPLLAIQSASIVSKAYMSSVILLFFAGFAIALGVERWGLHKRLALLCLLATGTSPKRIVLGFMLATGLLSMWISNTAATLLMLPIALAVITSVSQPDEKNGNAQTVESTTISKFAAALLLGIAYSASIGGLSTLIGTPTNAVYAGYWAESGASPQELQRYSVSSGQWLLMFLPVSASLFIAAWVLVCLPIWKGVTFNDQAKTVILQRYRALGKLEGGERLMLFVFLTTALLWISRASINIGGFVIPGWESGLTLLIQAFHPTFHYKGLLHDSTAGLAMLILMFLIPVRHKETKQYEYLMDWETIEKKTPWGILLLFGGGFAIAGACTSTGLSVWLGEILAENIEPMGSTMQIFSVSTLVIYLTEFTSNTATINTLLPVLKETAVALSLDPRKLMLPATIAASCAFMLPIATPPNAIVFSANRLSVWQMIRTGFWLNIIGIFIVTLITLNWSLQIGRIDEFVK